jgi:hypothetical protein
LRIDHLVSVPMTCYFSAEQVPGRGSTHEMPAK